MRGATIFGFRAAPSVDISIHAPHAGSDVLDITMRAASRISIHAPHAGSDHIRPAVSMVEGISIHAPHAGSDGWHTGNKRVPVHFNPRSPCGERPAHRGYLSISSIFQSTLPMRGATIDWEAVIKCAGISIHAPHAGSDAHEDGPGQSWQDFNPRSPCGERPKYKKNIYDAIVISIHAPHAGSDLSRDTWRLDTFKISIHAPHAGSDQSLLNNAII